MKKIILIRRNFNIRANKKAIFFRLFVVGIVAIRRFSFRWIAIVGKWMKVTMRIFAYGLCIQFISSSLMSWWNVRGTHAQLPRIDEICPDWGMFCVSNHHPMYSEYFEVDCWSGTKSGNVLHSSSIHFNADMTKNNWMEANFCWSGGRGTGKKWKRKIVENGEKSEENWTKKKKKKLNKREKLMKKNAGEKKPWQK